MCIFRFDLEKALLKNERLQRQLKEALENTRSVRSPSEQSSGEGVKESSTIEKSLSPSAVATTEKSPPVSNEEVNIIICIANYMCGSVWAYGNQEICEYSCFTLKVSLLQHK